jgi:hypothetical protein
VHKERAPSVARWRVVGAVGKEREEEGKGASEAVAKAAVGSCTRLT